MVESAKFEVEIVSTGERFTNFESWNIQQNYTTPADGFEFTVYDRKDPGKLRRTFRPWQNVNLYINGCLQVLGRIDSTDGVGDNNDSLSVRGRDYMGAFVDPPMDPSFRVSKGEHLDSLIQRALAPFGVNTVVGDGYNLARNAATGKNSRGVPSDFKGIPMEDMKPSDNQGTFQFLTSIVSRHGFTIQPTTLREWVALAAPDYSQQPLYEFRRSASNPSLTNILQGKASRDYTNVPSVTIATGRVLPKGVKYVRGTDEESLRHDAAVIARWWFGLEADKLSSQSVAVPARYTIKTFGIGSPSTIGELEEVRRVFNGVAVEEHIKPGTLGDESKVYKPLFYKDDKARNTSQLYYGLRRELAERLKDTLVYSVEVLGTAAPDGAIYCVDTLARVDDDVQDVHETMWIMDRSVSDSGNGAVTTLQLIRPGSFLL